MKNSTLIPALAVVATMLVNGCSGGAKKGTGGGAPVLVARAMETNVPVQIEPAAVGHVMPYSTVTIRPQVGGVISKVHFQEGQEVKKGDLLFTIDPRPMQAALAHDKAQLENAEIQFSREQKLFDQKLISQDEYDTSKASRDTLAATVQSDELNLSFTEIHAPFDGRTGSLQFHEGNVVKAPDDTLLTINQVHPIYVAFAVPEQYLPEIKREMSEKTLKVMAAFQNMDAPPQGELTFIDNAVDMMTGTIQLKATFPNEDNALWPGQFVQVALTLSELTNAIVVPSEAVQTGQNGQFVYVVKPDQTVAQRPVTIGITFQGATVVQSGLQAGETVVTDGQLRLEPGVKVSIKSAILSTNAP
ncbi:MAG: efflux RND transporter periplasmic adaptor subunit [Verrucomicrobiota bacterium]|jgi:multidrug efflux system membrane fusion protein